MSVSAPKDQLAQPEGDLFFKMCERSFSGLHPGVLATLAPWLRPVFNHL